MEERFNRLLRKAEESAQTANAIEADINKKSRELAGIVRCLDAISAVLDKEFPPPSFNPDEMNKELNSLRS